MHVSNIHFEKHIFALFFHVGHAARFELEVLAPLDRRVVSNTPVVMSNEETAELPSGRKERRRRWRFAETPVMSTYLLALVRETCSCVLLACFRFVCGVFFSSSRFGK